uniref:Uncharacterized protein n=1 Tax=Tanacetum cinerariifolium TaxID=118510 RepID=A0A699VQU7_TANCI|nr:hypothetical protein [Tanacetum cinerariifolium]
MLKEQKPNNSKLYSKGADKRRTFLSNVSLQRMMMKIHSLVRVVMKLVKVKGRVTKKKQGKRKRKVLIQFPELLKEVRMKAMMRRIKT